ncbi:MAG: glycogen synthase GlgA [Clostridia bacterium]|nr:glycogen synthase GlgA [Clostridia bacterium]
MNIISKNLNQKLKILLVSSEVVPFAKTGGLADVAGSLPKALAAMGHDVRVVMPKYREVGKKDTLCDFPVQVGNRKETAIVRQDTMEAEGGNHVPVYFIDNYHYFDRDGLYLHRDEGERFGFFCRAVLEMLPKVGFQPDIIHCNDWQSGPIPLLLKDQYAKKPYYSKIATLFTVHNLLYQGNWDKGVLSFLGLDEKYFHPEAVEFYGQVSFIKTGLVFSDVINTVSNTYAVEIQTPEYGEGMDGLLRKRAGDLYGIINGLNYEEFNPATDPHIRKNYDFDSIQDKKVNKSALQEELGLAVKDVPLIGLVSRLVDQKGLDLIALVMDELLSADVQLVVLGSGDPHYEQLFKGFQVRYPDKLGVYIGFNAELAQRIYAGSDLFLMPSKFEPCGLGQLISLRYGTIPIVRATGGLKDTINEFDGETGKGNGFSFVPYLPADLLGAIKRGLTLFRNQPEQWGKLVANALREDFSWDRSAKEYIRLYHVALGKHQGIN